MEEPGGSPRCCTQQRGERQGALYGAEAAALEEPGGLSMVLHPNQRLSLMLSMVLN